MTKRLALPAVAMLLLALTACGAASAASPTVLTSNAATAETASTTAPAPAPRVRGTATSRLRRDPSEPVFDGDFADPSAIVVDRAVYAFATNTGFANVPYGVARVGQHSSLSGDALPQLPSWSKDGSVWAPSVLDLGPNDFRLYYATKDAASGRQCISVAVATAPQGPYRDTSTGPLVCPVDLGGAIDPSPIVVGGTTYLLWKNDGNCCSLPTTIWSTPLTSDGLHTAGTATALIHNDQSWEGDVVEAPAMVEHDGRFFLFYSANAWDSREYATGYAVCDSVRGPCRKPLDHAWFGSDHAVSGPGGLSVFTGPVGDVHAIYHGWLGDKIGYDHGGARALFVAPLRWDHGAPVPPRAP